MSNRTRRGRKPHPPEQRFWAKVIKTDYCWIWSNAISDDGYGRFALHDGPGGMVRPHRFSFAMAHELEMSELPEEVMHACDVPICVNPDHLIDGDHQANMLDRQRKGRDSNMSLYFRGQSKKVLAARSRALQAEVITHGWQPHRISAILADQDPEAPTLF